MFKSVSQSLLWRGLLAMAAGIIAISWPGITIGAVVVIFAIGAFASAVAQAVQGFSSDRVGPVAGHLALAVLDVAAAVVAIAWPDVTAYALTIWIGAWAVVTGASELGMMFLAGEAAGRRALYAVAGLLSIAFGIVLFARPDIGAVSLAELFGIFSLAAGISTLALAASVHQTGGDIKSLRSAA